MSDAGLSVRPAALTTAEFADRLRPVAREIALARGDAAPGDVALALSGALGARRDLSDGGAIWCALFHADDLIDLRRADRGGQSVLRALGPSQLLVCDGDAFDRLEERDRAVAAAARAALRDQASRLRDHVADLIGRAPVARTAAALLELRRWPGASRPDDDGVEEQLRMPFSRADLAAYLGLTPETVSRSLRRLEEASLIARHSRGALRLLNLPRLRHAANAGV